MKTLLNLTPVCLLFVLFTSCSKTFFQVYSVVPSKGIVANDNSLIFEDDNCKIAYNLWDEGGNIGFRFTNKTNEDIHLDMEKCFFVLNGVSHNYFRNRTYTTPITADKISTKTSFWEALLTPNVYTAKDYTELNHNYRTQFNENKSDLTTNGFNVSTIQEEKLVCVPAHTTKIFKEYTVNNVYYRDCELERFPSKKQIVNRKYTKQDSPFIFGNRIAYYTGDSKELIRLENTFHVAEIANYPLKRITEYRYDKFCGQEKVYYNNLRTYFTIYAPDKFYITYKNLYDRWKY